MSLPKQNHIHRTPTKKNTQKKNPKRSEKPQVTVEFQNLKLEKERETKESKKQKRQSIEKKQRVPSAQWATNDDNELRLLKRLPS